MTDAIEIRTEQSGDFDAIHDVVENAFGREFEAVVVDRLRAGGDYIPQLALVAVGDGSVVGHIMITSQEIIGDHGSTIPTSILAPLAVAPTHQGQGIGQALTNAALEAARAGGLRSIVLVGHPTYYPRYGFRPAWTWGIRYARSVPDDVFMAVELVPGALAHASGIATPSPAFEEDE
jgi:predicted N-acetyltransferase YhbS